MPEGRPGSTPGPALSCCASSAQDATQLSLKLLPAVLSGPGLASLSGLALFMVIALSGNDLIVPEWVPAFTVAAVSVQVLNLGSGTSAPLALGASAIHSALWSLQVVAAQVAVAETLLPAVVESVTLSVYLVPLRTTDAAMLSPGFTVAPTNWMLLLGNISHQVR